MNEPRDITLISKAAQMLSEARTVDEVKNVRDIAEMARQYAKKARLGLEAQNKAAELKLRAEKKAGDILKEMGLNGGDRKSESHDARVKLEDVGIDKDQSSRWQRIAEIPEQDFEDFIADVREAGKELTTAAALRLTPKEPKESCPWSPTDVIEAINDAIACIWESTPDEYKPLIGKRLVSLGEELIEKGEPSW